MRITTGLALLSLVVGCDTRSATVIDVASLGYSTVSNAVAAAIDGDILRLPAGGTNWNAGLIITKNIIIKGAGYNLTIITNEVPKTSPETRLIKSVTTSTNGVFRISGIQFKGGIVSTQETTAGIIEIGGVCRSNRLDNCYFNLLHGVNVNIEDMALGVADHNVWLVNGVHPLTGSHDTWQPFNGATPDDAQPYTQGNGSWADDAYWGTDKFFFIESNVGRNIESPVDQIGIDMFQGFRGVGRFNNFTNIGFLNHGTEGQGRSAKQFEEYGNDFTMLGGTSPAGQIRGGGWLTYSNRYFNYTRGHELRVYRQFEWKDNWGWSNGTNVYDSNLEEPTNGWWARGTHTGGNDASALTDTTKSWTANQWVGTNHTFIIRNMTKYAALPVELKSQSFITGNSSTIITYSTLDNPNLRFDNGDIYEIWKLAESIDQPGLGMSNGRGNGLPMLPALWPESELETCYSWDNTFQLLSSQPSITAGRHFTNGITKSGYTGYTYPHPLTIPVTNTPVTVTLNSGATQDFNGAGGSGVYLVFELVTNNSGASLDQTTGIYTAGPISGVTDTIRITDSWGNHADSTASVTTAVPTKPGKGPKHRR